MIEFMKQGGFKAPEPSDYSGHAIIGLGSAGVNVLDQLVLDQRQVPSLYCFDTDEQTIRGTVVAEKMLLGARQLRGLGCGGDPGVAGEIVREERSDVRAMLQGMRTAILVTGLGGGTGSGMAREFVQILQELGVAVIVVAVTPFDFEGKRRLGQAQNAVMEIKQHADLVFCVSNSRLLHMPGHDMDIRQGFSTMNRLIGRMCMNLRAMLVQRGPMQIQLSDLRNLVAEHDCGQAALENCWVGFGEAEGQERARDVVDEVLSSPLFEDGRVWSNGTAVVASLAGGAGLSMGEFQSVIEYLRQEMPVELPILAGTVLLPDDGDRLRLILLVTGQSGAEEARPSPKKPAQELSFESVADDGQVTAQDYPDELPEETPAEVRKVQAEPAGAIAGDPGEGGELFSELPQTKQRKTAQKYFNQQEELQLEKKDYRGRFAKSDPTFFKGQDLDQPTFMRLNLKIRL